MAQSKFSINNSCYYSLWVLYERLFISTEFIIKIQLCEYKVQYKENFSDKEYC